MRWQASEYTWQGGERTIRSFIGAATREEATESAVKLVERRQAEGWEFGDEFDPGTIRIRRGDGPAREYRVILVEQKET